MSSDNPTLKQFLSAIFDDVPEGESPCMAMKRERGWLQVRPDHPATETLGPWYFCVSTVVDQARKKTLRRRAQDACAAYCVVLDDVGTKIAESDVAMGPPPSWVLESSPGNFQYGYLIDPEEDLDKYETVMAALAAAKLTDPGCVDRARVFRVPGSVNDKRAEPFAARVTLWEPEVTYALDELVEGFGLALGEIERKTFTEIAARAEDDEALSWLAENGHILKDKGEWIDVICPWHEEHNDPRAEAGYRPLDEDGNRAFRCHHGHGDEYGTVEFLRWVAAEGGPRVLGAEMPSPSVMAAVLERAGIDTEEPALTEIFTQPPSLSSGERQPTLEMLLERYALIEEGQLVGALSPGNPRPVRRLADFKAAHNTKVPVPWSRNPVLLSSAWQADCMKLLAQQYRPGAPIVFEERGAHWYNIWRAPAHPAVKGDPETFLEHVEYLLPNEAEREYLLDWLAFKLQHPERRLPAILMVADEVYGTGRSSFGDCLTGVWQHGVRPLTFEQFAGTGNQSQYDDWQDGLLIGIVDEAVATDVKSTAYRVKSAAYELIKERVDTRIVRDQTVNKKGGTTWLTDIYACYLIFTNHPDALPIPAHDRRLSVLDNAHAAQSPAYYKRVVPVLQSVEEQARVYWTLMARDVSQFDAGSSLKTPARERMIGASMSSLDEAVELMLEELPGRVISKRQWLAQIRARLGVAERQSNWEHAAERMWRRLPYPYGDKAAARVRHNGIREYVKQVRNGPILRANSGKKRYSRWLQKEMKRNEPKPTGPQSTDRPFS
ncbi:MAG: DNA-primase RepB domain-containing protein [Woeseiaceae bacterium]|nr:DNA-primase RepB domain-containing protein [Woeseiaceae bacterium]